MTTPTKATLPLVGGGSWYNTNREYRLESAQTTSTAVFYELYTNGSGDVQFGIEIRNDNKIYVMTSNNNLGNPHVVNVGNFVTGQTSVSIADGNRVSLYHNDGTLLGQIDVDTSMLFSGSGPSTLSVVPTRFTQIVPSGVTSVTHPGDLGRQLYYSIAKSRSSGTYNIYLDDVFHISVTHTTGSVSAGQVAGEQYGQNYKLYFGQVFTSSSLNTLVAEFTWRSTKKVHSNFW
jgi:hypothetical protein